LKLWAESKNSNKHKMDIVKELKKIAKKYNYPISDLVLMYDDDTNCFEIFNETWFAGHNDLNYLETIDLNNKTK